MEFLRRFRPLAYAMALLSIVGFTYAQQAFSLLIIGVAMVAVSWRVAERPDGKPVPRWMINTGVILAAIGLFVELVVMRQQNLLIGLGHFMMALLVCKLFERKTNRDYGQIMILSLLIMMSATILTASMAFGLLLALYLAIGLYASLVFHLRCETQRAIAHRAATDAAMVMPGSTGAVARDIWRVTALSMVSLLAFSLLVFLGIPRGLVPAILARWRVQPDSSHASTGFSDHVAFGDIGRLQLSNKRVMTVRLERDGKNIGNAGYQPYFCGQTLDVYDSRTRQWIRSTTAYRIIRHPHLLHHRATLLPPGQYDPRGLVTARYSLLADPSHRRPPLFTIAPPVAVASRQIRFVAEQQDLTLRCRPPRHWPLRYSVTTARHYSRVVYGPRPMLFPLFRQFFPFGAPFPGVVRSAPIPPAVAAMARRVAGPLLHRHPAGRQAAAKRDIALAKRFAGYLSSHYPYSLRLRAVDPAMDPTEDFLLHKQKIGADCEYFASAMVMFCRSVGLPARMATGYMGGDYNSRTGAYVVRERFAHAWVQVWVPGQGWTRFDPTPPGSIPGPPYVPFWKRWFNSIYNFLERTWFSKIINFSNANRRSLLAGFENLLHAIGARIAAFFHALQRQILLLVTGHGSLMPDGLYVLAAAGVVAAAAFALRRWNRARRSMVARVVKGLDRTTQRQWMRELFFFDRLAAGLRRMGYTRTEHQTPREFVDAAAQSLGPAAGNARWLVGTFYDIRYGGTQVTPELRREIAGQLDTFEQHIRRNRNRRPRWRGRKVKV